MHIDEMLMANRSACTGCASCANICPTKCIQMIEDAEGFLYPQVDKDKCIHCNLCASACPMLSPVPSPKKKLPAAYVFIHADEDIRRTSSSGGAFQALSQEILHEDGIVFGAGFDEHWEVVHQAVEHIANMDKLQGSKYLQSRIETTYCGVKKELLAGRNVLFSGTPCQCAALRQFLGKSFKNLILVDIICHGVPSPKVWRQYIALRAGGKMIQKISFRDKKVSWEKYMLSFSFDNDSIYLAEDFRHDLYMKGFLQNLFLRPSCHICPFCKANRPTDLTLADFWGVKKVEPSIYDAQGTSLVFVHSPKGAKLFDALKGRKKETVFEKAVEYNPSMLYPAKAHPKREEFFQKLNMDFDLELLLQQYTRTPWKQIVYRYLRRILGH